MLSFSENDMQKQTCVNELNYILRNILRVTAGIVYDPCVLINSCYQDNLKQDVHISHK